MISKHQLAQAKAFLCWDRFPDLTIKLVPLKEAVAFYYPPSTDIHTLVVFYPEQSPDLSQALFLLFHEVGHYVQYGEYARDKRQQEFWEFIHQVNGSEKVDFEQEAWNRGADLLRKFLRKAGLPEHELTSAYADYVRRCLASYDA